MKLLPIFLIALGSLAGCEVSDFHRPAEPWDSSGPEAAYRPPPDRLAGETPWIAPAPADAAAWTCPMHPEVKQPKPGDCPICGMTLQPVAKEKK